MYQPKKSLTGERAGLEQLLLFQHQTHITAASTLPCKCTRLHLYKCTHFTRTLRVERMDCSLEKTSERCERDVVVTGQDDTSTSYSAMQWSIFILRTAKWGHSGGLAEYIPHLHHESSAAYYSCPAQRGLLSHSNELCVYRCACASVDGAHKHASFRAQDLPKAQKEGMDTAHVTDREQVV